MQTFDSEIIDSKLEAVARWPAHTTLSQVVETVKRSRQERAGCKPRNPITVTAKQGPRVFFLSLSLCLSLSLPLPFTVLT